jgi:fucose permease
MRTTEPSRVSLAVGLSAASFGVLGAAQTLPGTLLPLLVEHFRIRLFEAGSMLALQPIGYLICVLAAGRLIERFGMRAVLAVGLLLSAAGLAGFGTTSQWMTGALTMFLIGLGYGVMEVATNTLLITIGGERRSNLLNFAHLFFGIGSFVGPLLAAHAVAAGWPWRITFFAAAIITALVAAGWACLQLPAAHSAPSDAPQPRAHSSLAVLLALLLALYVGTELGIGGWLTKYMVAVRGVSLTYAGNALSLYWLGLTAGRLVLSVLAHRVSEGILLCGLALVATAAAACGLLVPSPGAAVACFALTGAGFSGIFPAVIALGGRSHPHNVAGVTSVMITGAGLGGIVLPWTMSAIADGFGLTTGMSFYAGGCAGMAILALVLNRILARRALPS